VETQSDLETQTDRDGKEWRWKWKKENGQWSAYSLSNSMRIESAYRNEVNSIEITKGDVVYEVRPRQLIECHFATNRMRSIQRVEKVDSVQVDSVEKSKVTLSSTEQHHDPFEALSNALEDGDHFGGDDDSKVAQCAADCNIEIESKAILHEIESLIENREGPDTEAMDEVEGSSSRCGLIETEQIAKPQPSTCALTATALTVCAHCKGHIQRESITSPQSPTANMESMALPERTRSKSSRTMQSTKSMTSQKSRTSKKSMKSKKALHRKRRSAMSLDPSMSIFEMTDSRGRSPSAVNGHRPRKGRRHVSRTKSMVYQPGSSGMGLLHIDDIRRCELQRDRDSVDSQIPQNTIHSVNAHSVYGLRGAQGVDPLEASERRKPLKRRRAPKGRSQTVDLSANGLSDKVLERVVQRQQDAMSYFKRRHSKRSKRRSLAMSTSLLAMQCDDNLFDAVHEEDNEESEEKRECMEITAVQQRKGTVVETQSDLELVEGTAGKVRLCQECVSRRFLKVSNQMVAVPNM